jgi:16S rRNA (guanine527-N7)-methyltransferase
VLLDASERRTVFLEDAIEMIGVADRVSVVHGAAEDHARADEARGGFDVVVARSFGPPPVVAECAAPFLRVGGRLVVSEPPFADGTRWPAAELATLGLAIASESRSAETAVIVLRLEHLSPAGVPRRAGLPKARPLW